MTPEARRILQRYSKPVQIILFTYADAQGIVNRLNAIGAKKFEVTIKQANAVNVYEKDLEEFKKLNPDALVNILPNPETTTVEVSTEITSVDKAVNVIEEITEKRGPGRPKKV